MTIAISGNNAPGYFTRISRYLGFSFHAMNRYENIPSNNHGYTFHGNFMGFSRLSISLVRLLQCNISH